MPSRNISLCFTNKTPPPEINSLSLPLSEDELSALIDSLISALNDINLVNTGVEVSAPDKARVEALLDRAKVGC